jgi:hypothetical protein
VGVVTGVVTRDQLTALSALGQVRLLRPHPVPSSPACHSTPRTGGDLRGRRRRRRRRRRQELLEVRMGDPAAGLVDDERAPRVPGPPAPCSPSHTDTQPPLRLKHVLHGES